MYMLIGIQVLYINAVLMYRNLPAQSNDCSSSCLLLSPPSGPVILLVNELTQQLIAPQVRDLLLPGASVSNYYVQVD